MDIGTVHISARVRNEGERIRGRIVTEVISAPGFDHRLVTPSADPRWPAESLLRGGAAKEPRL